MAVTWNPADKNANIVLSNGDLTATGGTLGNKMVRATEGKSSGKWYFECTYTTPSYATAPSQMKMGIAQLSESLNQYVGYDSGGWGWGDVGTKYNYDPETEIENEPWGIGGYAGAVVMCAFDLDNGKIWWGLDGTWFESGNPATGVNPAYSNVSGTVYPACTPHRAETEITAQFTEESQIYRPSGFLPVDYDPSIPAESLAWTPQPLSQDGHVRRNFLPAESLAWTPQAPVNGLGRILPAESLTWTPQAPGALLSHSLPAGGLVWTAQRPQQTYDAPSFAIARAVYRCALTGDAETPPVADLELPLASFQSRRRNGTQTYLAISVPNPSPYIDGINARLNGDIVIYSGFAIGATETITELLRVNFGSFRYDLGPRSGSASLSGHKQVTYSNPKTRALSGISYQSVTDGVNLVRCEPDMWLNPGDTADIGGSTFVVDTITYIVKPTLAYMEVQEVAA